MADQLPHNPSDSNRSILGEFLKFLGLMLTVGGSLAILRTAGVAGRWFSGPQFFFTLLLPIGLILWAVGLYLARPNNDGSGGGDHG